MCVERDAALAAYHAARWAERVDSASPPQPPGKLDIAATRLALACTEHTRDHECGCSGRRCSRSGELVSWGQCLACKAPEVTPAPPPPDPEPDPPPPEPAEIDALVDACNYRYPLAGYGCCGVKCLKGDTPVSRLDCRACQTEPPPETPP